MARHSTLLYQNCLHLHVHGTAQPAKKAKHTENSSSAEEAGGESSDEDPDDEEEEVDVGELSLGQRLEAMSAELDADAAAAKAKEWALVSKQQQQQQRAAKPPRADSLSAVLIQACVCVFVCVFTCCLIA
jgi:thioredoxin-like negative regulator of GroEL